MGEVETRVTAQSVAGDAAVVAYSARRSKLGPNGESDVALVLRTEDRGVTWTPLPFTREVWSFFRFFGFPVWPPEAVSAVELRQDTVVMTFRDEHVLYEPGGESLWTGTWSRRNVWRIRRVRRMQYETNVDDSSTLPSIALELPAGFTPPDEALVQRLAVWTGSYFSTDAPLWLWLIPALAAGMLIGAGRVLSAVGLMTAAVIGLPSVWILLDRRRRRRELDRAESAIAVVRK